MSTVIDILRQLGVNETLFVQLAIFIAVFSVLHTLVFRPYFSAYEKRKGATQGNAEVADKLINQTRELEASYQHKARELSAQIKSIYEKARLEALVEQDKIMAESRENTQRILEKARLHIEEETALAREKLNRETPEIGAAIADRLLGPGGAAL